MAAVVLKNVFIFPHVAMEFTMVSEAETNACLCRRSHWRIVNSCLSYCKQLWHAKDNC